MDRLKYRAIGTYNERVITGYEVVLASGWRGVGETIDEAVRAAKLAESTHEARIDRMRWEAGRLHEELHARGGNRSQEIPF